jgi:uncharacterized protein
MNRNRIVYLILLVAIIVGLIAVWTLVLKQPLTYGVLLIAVFGFLLAAMDTALGMGFGTLGTPILLIIGLSSKLAVPSILIAQAISATFGFALHNRYKNVNLLSLGSKDQKIAIRMVSFGVIGTIIAVIIAISIPKIYLNTYIGLLIIVMGGILLLRSKTAFSWMKINLISFVSGFNKAISGGGYGPVATTGLIVAGHPLKNSVGITLFSVAVINVLAFILYLFSSSITSYGLPIFLTIGALLGAQIGPKATGAMHSKRIRYAFAIVVIILGILTIATTIWAVPQLLKVS